MHLVRVPAQQYVGLDFALGGGAADDSGNGLLVDRVIARVDPLGAESDEDVFADFEAALSQGPTSRSSVHPT
jgi:hypothetical protein